MTNYITLKLKLTIAFILLVVFVNNSYSQDLSAFNLSVFKNGMSEQEVIAIIGAPIERKENEVKRVQVLIYNNLKFFFKEGKLVLPKKDNGNDKFQKNSSANNYNQYINNSLNSKPEFSDSEVRDIFEKISSEGGGPDAPTAGGATNSGTPQMAPPLVRE